LMRLLEVYLRKELSVLVDRDIVFKVIGETWRLPENIRALVHETEEKTASNKGMTLVTALSYSGRSEILRALKRAAASGCDLEGLTEEAFSQYLDTADLPSPDLIIRTSGERRLSNFLLWQSAYAELYFTDTLWPDFDRSEMLLAIQDFQGRERRFGAISVRSNAS
ncbi:MAG TPA: polyprenyl diphosphate synthase, partial [Candidatus Sulfobium mesophilum]|nr:polyprenyl diphosphate synthase [Candidatus Sulfobium mesophilum]